MKRTARARAGCCCSTETGRWSAPTRRRGHRSARTRPSPSVPRSKASDGQPVTRKTLLLSLLATLILTTLVSADFAGQDGADGRDGARGLVVQRESKAPRASGELADRSQRRLLGDREGRGGRSGEIAERV